jgi:hypothetical protein
MLQAFFQSAQNLYEKRGSGSVPLTNGSGSGRPKIIRIPDTQSVLLLGADITVGRSTVLHSQNLRYFSNVPLFRVIDVGPPKKPVRRTNADGNLTLVQRLLLYDFLEVRKYIGLGEC